MPLNLWNIIKNLESEKDKSIDLDYNNDLIDNWIFNQIKSLIGNNINKTFNNENNELTKKLDILNNTLLFEQKISKNKNKLKYNIEKKKISQLFNLEKLKKIKGISAEKLNIKNRTKKSDIIKF